jgi:para-aminobenzoate synthetase component 1
MLQTLGTTRVADAIVAEIEPVDLGMLMERSVDLGGVPSALLESTLPGETWGRWSFFAPGGRTQYSCAPDGTWQSFPEFDEARVHPVDSALRDRSLDPWSALDRAWRQLHDTRVATWPSAGGFEDGGDALVPPFRGGFLVAIAYDAARFLPDFQPWPGAGDTAAGHPLFDLRLTGEIVACHAATGRTFLVASTHPIFGDAEPRLAALAQCIEPFLAPRVPDPDRPPADRSLRSTMSDADYARAFARLQDYLRAGDLYQANLTRAFRVDSDPAVRNVLHRLRAAAPAPYSAFFGTRSGPVLCASPELFLARTGDRLVTRPIKGTRPRRAEPVEDAAEARDLLSSAKDRAEHVMIVDVHRNDLGRVCEYGSVRVETLAGLESFPTVHHLTSTVVGRPRAGVTPWQAIAAAFPAGSITGAPKRRAIEVIAELEPTSRGFYCGSMGWIGLDGDFALNVAIRLMQWEGHGFAFHAGGGIVIDSQLEAEAAETWNKARALYAAIDPEGSAARERTS